LRIYSCIAQFSDYNLRVKANARAISINIASLKASSKDDPRHAERIFPGILSGNIRPDKKMLVSRTTFIAEREQR